jgi:hypothetical protein
MILHVLEITLLGLSWRNLHYEPPRTDGSFFELEEKDNILPEYE